MARKPVTNLDIDKDTRDTLGKTIGRDFNDAFTASAGMRANWSAYRDQYDGTLAAKELDWQANDNMPLVEWMVEMAALRIAALQFGVEPYFELEAIDPEYDDVASAQEFELQYWNDRTRLRSKGGMAIREALIMGQAWIVPGVKPTGNSLPNSTTIRPHDLDFEPTCHYVVSEDIMLTPWDAPNFDGARGAFERVWLRWNDLVKAEASLYPDVLDDIEQYWATGNPTSQVQNQQGIEAGNAQDVWGGRFECYEGVYRWTKPGATTETDYLVLTYCDMTNGASDAIVLKCVEYEPQLGKTWRFCPIIVNPQPNSLWGRPLSKSLQGLQKWTNAQFNQSTDAITMAIMPPLLVPPGFERKKITWGPLEKIPNANPNNPVQMMGVNQGVLSAINLGMAQIEMVRNTAERISGQNDTAAGKETSQDKTLGEIQLTVQKGSERVEYQLGQVQIGMEDGQGFEGYAQMMLRILDRFLPNVPISYRTGKGPDSEVEVDPTHRTGHFRVVAHGNSSSSNPQIRMAKAKALKEFAGASAFLQVSPVDTPEQVLEKIKRLYAIDKRVFQSIGEKNIETYLGDEPQTIEEAIAIVAIINPQVAALIAQKHQASQGIVAGPAMGQPGLPGGPGGIEGGANALGPPGTGAGGNGGGAIPQPAIPSGVA